MDEKVFIKRYEQANQRKQQWDSILEDAYSLFLPNRQSFGSSKKGEANNTKIYDSVGVASLQEFANTLKQSLLPSYQEWASILPSGKVEAEVSLGLASSQDRDELARQMEVVNRTIFNYIWGSNFDQAVHEAIQDMAISTGALLVLDSGKLNNPLKFVSVPANELVPECGPNGDIETVYRRHSVAVRDIAVLFPKADADSNISSLVQSNGSKSVTVIEGTIYNPDTGKYDYIVHIAEAQRKIFYQDEYEVSPWVVFRANVAPNEVMGRGPAMTALPSMRILNKLVAQLIYNNDMAINPPLVVNSSSSLLDVSNVRVAPNSILPTKGDYSGVGSPFQYLETRANFNVGIGMRNEYQDQIRNMFHLPMIGGMSDPTKSATEMTIRNQQALSQQAAMFGRLQQELVSKIIKRCHYILGTYNIVPLVLKIDGEIAEVKATSPLSRVQDTADLEGLMQFIQTTTAFGEQGNALLASTLDVEQLGPYLADKLNVPAALKLSADKRMAIAQQMQQAMVQQGVPMQ